MSSLRSIPPRPPGRSPFDVIRRVDENADGSEFEYWSAREAQPHLGYLHWQGIENVIRKARAACRNSGHDPGDHFRDTPKMVAIGSGANRNLVDVHMTRFGMYLLAMNGDPDKPEIAAAQRYFVIQTRRAEVQLPPPAAPPPPAPALRPWYERFSRTFMPHVRDLNEKYPGCFSVVSATVYEMMHLEDQIVRHLMTTRSIDRPDVSIGKRWAAYRRDDLLLPEVIRSAILHLPDQGLDVEVKVYEGREWPEFQMWLRNCYLPEHLATYLNNKKELKTFPELTRYSTADNTSRNLGGRPAQMPQPTRAALAAAGGFAPAPRRLPPRS